MTAGAVAQVLQRLEEVVQQETAALRSHRVVDLQDFNTRKSQGLLELSRLLRIAEGAPLDKILLARLKSLREMLEANRTVLKIHLDAAHEISTIMADAIRDSESDGTYSPSLRGAGPRP
jgi:flagellar biosynthesis/type III secretory pathway chaperone